MVALADKFTREAKAQETRRFRNRHRGNNSLRSVFLQPQNRGPATKNRILSAKYLDQELNGYEYGLRIYLVELARWANRDPLGEDGGVNVYGFSRNEPIGTTDHLGLYAIPSYEIGTSGYPSLGKFTVLMSGANLCNNHAPASAWIIFSVPARLSLTGTISKGSDFDSMARAEGYPTPYRMRDFWPEESRYAATGKMEVETGSSTLATAPTDWLPVGDDATKATVHKQEPGCPIGVQKGTWRITLRNESSMATLEWKFTVDWEYECGYDPDAEVGNCCSLKKPLTVLKFSQVKR